VAFAPFRGFRVSESPADKELYQRQIEATDRQIDGLVYGLYGLTEEEVGISRRAESLNALREVRTLKE
jgi:hypothetical protein